MIVDLNLDNSCYTLYLEANKFTFYKNKVYSQGLQTKSKIKLYKYGKHDILLKAIQYKDKRVR